MPQHDDRRDKNDSIDRERAFLVQQAKPKTKYRCVMCGRLQGPDHPEACKPMWAPESDDGVQAYSIPYMRQK